MSESTLTEEAASGALDLIADRVVTVQSSVDGFPFVYDEDGDAWETTPDGNWCAGHWIGLLRTAADRVEDGSRLDAAADRATGRMLDGDSLLASHFAGMNYLYAGFRSYDRTGDRRQFGLGLTGADAMADLFHERGRQVAVGEFDTKGPGDERIGDAARERPDPPLAAVDVVYTALPVLWRAYRETGRERFRDVALSHADRHLDWFVLEDASTVQLRSFDQETGQSRATAELLAAGEDTCWARGQGWSVAGLARAYTETGAERYLRALERIVDYWRDHTPADLVPRWDFEVSGASEPRDASAAALAAYGLLGIRGPGGERVAALRAVGRRLLGSLVDDYVVTEGPRRGAVLHTCYDRPEAYATDVEAVWTEYYVARALVRFIESA